MSLSLYNKKRNFSETTEPEGKEKNGKGALRFVIQKHDASQVHYDFRLEMDGVLKSWAVPKGPSLNPKDKRLAMQVEDHPFDYRNFEGVIPEGRYGAGVVIIWDEGTYEPADTHAKSRKEQEAELMQQLEDGRIAFVLHGHKIKGEYALVKMKKGDENAWMLIKKNDEDVITETDITANEASVVSGKTLAQIATENGVELHPPQATKQAGSKIKTAKTNHTKKTVSKATTVKKSHSTSTAASGIQLNLEDGKDQTITLQKQKVHVTNLDKLYWKKEGYRKLDLINYYLKIAPYILPYIVNRPQSLNRYPNGINSAHFFQKDVKGKVPDWIQTFEFFSESTNETIEYLICTNEASLIYMANLGCIEIHPWHSTIQSPDYPDYCLIDLDPDTNNNYEEVVAVAQVVKRILDAVNVPAYCKTSGSTGMHICIPLGAKYTYDQSKQLAELIVTLVHQEVPDLTSLERNPDKRKGKIYLDFLQNALSQTMAAPYSLRPKPDAPVSTPLHWDEVKKGISATMYTIRTIFDRLQQEGDLFRPVIEKGIDLADVLQKMESHF